MKKSIFILVLVLIAFAGNAQVKAKKLKPYLSTTTYCVPGVTPFVENAIAFECRSAVYKQFEPGKFKATVQIITTFRKGDETTFSKVALDSPVETDTSNLKGAFIGQQRFPLTNGEYQMEISITDMNSGEALPTESVTVELNYPDNVPSVSDILLFDTYTKASKTLECTKSGYDFLPRVYPFYGSSENKLNFYAELYNSDKYFTDGGQYMLNYYVQSYESSRKMNDFNFIKRLDVAPVNILLNTINIKNLPTGNYYLVVEMRDRSNNLMASNKVFFQRYNPGCEMNLEDIASTRVINTFAADINNIDTLREYIRCLSPRCSEAERNYCENLVKTDDMNTMQQFLYTFWSTRAPLNPKEAWEEYYAHVKMVNASYSTKTKKGYMTDRGYVYLKYGTPDKICEEPFEPGAYPYEIWHYYEVAGQHNKHCVFMSQDMVTNDYELIHSDIIGEVNNPRWQMMIYSRFYGPDYTGDIIDQTEAPGAWGTRAGDLYRNPR